MGETRYARVNYTIGRALIIEKNDTCWTLEVLGEQVVGPTPLDPRTNLCMWLQLGTCRTVDPGDAPYDELKQVMLVERRVAAAMEFFIHAIDPDLGLSLRQRSAELLNRFLGDDTVQARVLETVLAVPIPPNASTRDAPFTGRGAEVFAAAISKYGHSNGKGVPHDAKGKNRVSTPRT